MEGIAFLSDGVHAMRSWLDQELAGCRFADARLGTRFRVLMDRLSDGLGRTIPLACGDWAATKAAYRFLDNDRVSESEVLGGHFAATRDRFAAIREPVLVLHDTTEFSFTREKTHAVGVTHRCPTGSKDGDGRRRLHTVCGILMHSSLVVTTDGLPLGLAAVKLWTRKKFKGTSALQGHGIGCKHTVNAARIPIEQKESVRWLENVRQSTANLGDASRCVHIGDRESDIYELFCECESLGSKFVFRTCVDRRADNGDRTVHRVMDDQPVKGVHRVEVRDADGNPRTAALELRYHRMRVCPPIGKEKRYDDLELTVIHATERGPVRGREPIEWKLITNLPIRSRSDAIEKLEWYAMRWRIETFHKVMKSGCRAEESKLRTADRLAKLIAIMCILAWRTLWLTMVNRTSPDLPATLVFTDVEIQLLTRLVPAKHGSRKKTVGNFLIRVARLGGYLNRAKDPPPGNMVLWRGMARLTDIHLGYCLAKVVGN